MTLLSGCGNKIKSTEADPTVVPPKVAAEPARRLPGEYSGFEPAVAADGKGRVVVVAIDVERIIAWTSADGGKTFELPNEPLEAGRQQADPWIHATGPGRFLLSLMGTRGKKTGVKAHLLRSEDGGRGWKPTQEFGSGPMFVDRPIFAVSRDGRRLAAVSFWSGQREDPPRDLFSTDGAASWLVGPTPLTPPGSACMPTGVAISDEGRTVVGYRIKGPRVGGEASYSFQLGTTADGGQTWRRHDLGRLADQLVSPVEEAADIDLKLSQVGLAHDGAGSFHVVTTQRTAKARPVEVRYWRSTDGERWTEPKELSGSQADIKAYPAVAAYGPRVHVVWLEIADGWCNVRYRGSADGGNSWTECVTLSKPAIPSGLQTAEGFRSYSGHYMGIAEDGYGAAHVVWAVRGSPEKPMEKGEVWHTVVRMQPR